MKPEVWHEVIGSGLCVGRDARGFYVQVNSIGVTPDAASNYRCYPSSAQLDALYALLEEMFA